MFRKASCLSTLITAGYCSPLAIAYPSTRDRLFHSVYWKPPFHICKAVCLWCSGGRGDKGHVSHISKSGSAKEMHKRERQCGREVLYNGDHQLYIGKTQPHILRLSHPMVTALWAYSIPFYRNASSHCVSWWPDIISRSPNCQLACHEKYLKSAWGHECRRLSISGIITKGQ